MSNNAVIENRSELKMGPNFEPIPEPGPNIVQSIEKDTAIRLSSVLTEEKLACADTQVPDRQFPEDDILSSQNNVDGDNDADAGDDEFDLESAQDEDALPIDVIPDTSCVMLDENDNSFDAEEGLPIRVYQVKDDAGNVWCRCFAHKFAIGHKGNTISDAIANRDRIVTGVAEWVEKNRQNFLHTFDVEDLRGDSEEQAYKEAIASLEQGGRQCPVIQEGLLCLIGEKIGKGKGSQTPNFSKYMKVLSLQSDDLGIELNLQVLFSREAQHAWAAAAIRGFINGRTHGSISIQDYLRRNFNGPIKARRGRGSGDEFIQQVIGLLKISYKDIETKVLNER